MEKLLRTPRPTMDTIVSGLCGKVSELLPKTSPDDVPSEALLDDLNKLLREAIEKGETQPVYRILKQRVLEVAKACILQDADVDEVMAGSRFMLVRAFTDEI